MAGDALARPVLSPRGYSSGTQVPQLPAHRLQIHEDDSLVFMSARRSLRAAPQSIVAVISQTSGSLEHWITQGWPSMGQQVE